MSLLDEYVPRPARKWPLLLRVSECAFELGLSTRRVYQLINEGKLEARKIGKATGIVSASMRKLAGDIDAKDTK